MLMDELVSGDKVLIDLRKGGWDRGCDVQPFEATYIMWGPQKSGRFRPSEEALQREDIQRYFYIVQPPKTGYLKDCFGIYNTCLVKKV